MDYCLFCQRIKAPYQVLQLRSPQKIPKPSVHRINSPTRILIQTKNLTILRCPIVILHLNSHLHGSGLFTALSENHKAEKQQQVHVAIHFKPKRRPSVKQDLIVTIRLSVLNVTGLLQRLHRRQHLAFFLEASVEQHFVKSKIT